MRRRESKSSTTTWKECGDGKSGEIGATGSELETIGIQGSESCEVAGRAALLSLQGSRMRDGDCARMDRCWQAQEAIAQRCSLLPLTKGTTKTQLGARDLGLLRHEGISRSGISRSGMLSAAGGMLCCIILELWLVGGWHFSPPIVRFCPFMLVVGGTPNLSGVRSNG